MPRTACPCTSTSLLVPWPVRIPSAEVRSHGVGLCEVLVMYPLDVVKTRMQLATAGERIGMVGAFSEVIKKEGCVGCPQ